MGYYDKERVRGFLHNQDGIIVNDFGEEVILRGWGMGRVYEKIQRPLDHRRI